MSTTSLTTGGKTQQTIQARRILLHPFRLLVSARLWRSLVFLALNIPLGTLYFTVLVTLLSLGLGLLTIGIGLLPLILTPPAILICVRIERWRVSRLLGGALASPQDARSFSMKGLFGESSAVSERRFSPGALIRRSWELAKERDTLRGMAYLLLLFLMGSAEGFAFKTQVGAFKAVVGLPLLNVVAPDPQRAAETGFWELLGVTGWPWLVAILCIIVAILWLVAEAYLIVGAAALHRLVAEWLLGPSPDEQRARLEARVQALDLSRTRLVDAVLMERQRLERDLHDGAQQRLVALALNLGMAREKLATQPEEAHELVAEAHEEAKRALAELRDLVRGIHPAVLTDRGLDPALSALAARCPVPVAVTVDLPERPPEVVEATAYFVAAEALTNIAKHSGATAASIEARRVRKMLRLRIDDNGHGGADPADGTGLVGIADRVAALDGRLTITSPAGGPTSLVVELPWKEGGASAR